MPKSLVLRLHIEAEVEDDDLEALIEEIDEWARELPTLSSFPVQHASIHDDEED